MLKYKKLIEIKKNQLVARKTSTLSLLQKRKAITKTAAKTGPRASLQSLPV
jgi:hypothetical protein